MDRSRSPWSRSLRTSSTTRSVPCGSRRCATRRARGAKPFIACSTRRLPTARGSRAVRRALALLRARLAEPVTLDELAAHAGLDKSRLCRACRAEVGLPPHAWLTELRVVRAKELLASGTAPSDVVPLVGFYDQSRLNRHFRRIVGTTPGRWARQCATVR